MCSERFSGVAAARQVDEATRLAAILCPCLQVLAKVRSLTLDDAKVSAREQRRLAASGGHKANWGIQAAYYSLCWVSSWLALFHGTTVECCVMAGKWRAETGWHHPHATRWAGREEASGKVFGVVAVLASGSWRPAAAVRMRH